ncbi:MAG TPA: UxaA family hydrolase [Acidimicrobiales bacterium]
MGEQLAFLAHRQDDMVAVAVRDVETGHGEFASLDSGERRPITVREPIKLGHKVALVEIAEGEEVIEYGQKVAIATADIAVGALVHVHNVRSARWQLA